MSNDYDCGGLGCGHQPCICDVHIEVQISDAGGTMTDIMAQHMRHLQYWGKPTIMNDIGVYLDPAAVAAAPAPPMMRDSGFICEACGDDRLSGDGDMRERCPSCGGKTKAMQIIDGRIVKGFL